MPPAVKFLSEVWKPHYENDPLIAPHWEVLTREKVVSIRDKEYFLYQGKIRVGVRIYVPVALTKQVFEAQHGYAHSGTGNTDEMLRCRYQAGIEDSDSPVVESCPVCQTVKARKGVQPQSCHSY